MTTWLHYPFSHPWMSTLKRKYSDDESEGDSPSPPPTSQCSPARLNSHLPKRRRYDLSRNLSRLSLFERIYPIIEEPQQQQQYLDGFPTRNISLDSEATTTTMASHGSDMGYEEMDADMNMPSQSTTAIVEEPVEYESPQPVAEVRMRGSSSYEPEKDRAFFPSPHTKPPSSIKGIVITDLDSSDSESEQDDSSKPYTISPKVLSQLNAANRIPLFKSVHPDLLMEANASKAIVLYRPTPWSAADSHTPPPAANAARGQGPSIEDAMDLE